MTRLAATSPCENLTNEKPEEAPEPRAPRGTLPREKLGALGVARLTDAELITLLLGSGVEGRSAVRMGRLLARRRPSELPHGRSGAGSRSRASGLRGQRRYAPHSSWADAHSSDRPQAL